MTNLEYQNLVEYIKKNSSWTYRQLWRKDCTRLKRETGYKSCTRRGPTIGIRWRKNKNLPLRECSIAFSMKSTMVLDRNFCIVPKLKLPMQTREWIKLERYSMFTLLMFNTNMSYLSVKFKWQTEDIMLVRTVAHYKGPTRLAFQQLFSHFTTDRTPVPATLKWMYYCWIFWQIKINSHLWLVLYWLRSPGKEAFHVPYDYFHLWSNESIWKNQNVPGWTEACPCLQHRVRQAMVEQRQSELCCLFHHLNVWLSEPEKHCANENLED